MFGKAEDVVEKYPVFFTLRLLISSILRGKALDALSRVDQPSYYFFSKEKELVFYVYYLMPCFSFALLKLKEAFTRLANSMQMNLILGLNAYIRTYINDFKLQI